MGEFSFRYYKRYLKVKLELETLEEEIKCLKSKQDRMAYSGCKDVKAVNYSNEKGNSNVVSSVEDITTFYDDFIELTKIIRNKEQEAENLNSALKNMEHTFLEYSKECNDLEMKVFIDFYVHNKKLTDVLIPKPNSSEFYSYRQIKRYYSKLKNKLKKYWGNKQC